MIKKARAILLGDRIAGRTVRLITRTGRRAGEFDSLLVLHFLDGGNSLDLPSGEYVWVDNPDTLLPVLHDDERCKPPDGALQVLPGDILYIQLASGGNDTYRAKVYFDKGGYLHTCFPDGATIIKEVRTCTVSCSGLLWA